MLEKGLKDKTPVEDYSYFLKCLSDVLLQMWRFHPHVKDSVGYFIDKTKDIQEFNDNIYKTPGSYQKMLNKHCWPVVRCPLRCW